MLKRHTREDDQTGRITQLLKQAPEVPRFLFEWTVGLEWWRRYPFATFKMETPWSIFFKGVGGTKFRLGEIRQKQWVKVVRTW